MSVNIQPTAIHFDKVQVGAQSAQELTIKNQSSAEIVVKMPAQGPPNRPFKLVPSEVRVAANQTLVITVVFEPTAEGALTDNVSVGSVLVPLSGAGVAQKGWEKTEQGSYMLVKVPDYTDGLFEKRQDASGDLVSEQATMTSYLRLGSFDWTKESEPAKELLRVIPQAGSPGDPRRGDDALYPAFDFSTINSFDDFPGVKALIDNKDLSKIGNREAFFLDDVRTRAADLTTDPGHGLTIAQRVRESARLYTRGGWRDHSDGNRISTTYGDKVEVVRGNYKMIVLGRQDDPGEAMGWEVGGSHIQDYAPGTMPGASMFLEWVPDYSIASGPDARSGVWLLVNTTENVYEYARKAGNFREETWGDVHEAYIGSENPPDGTVNTEGAWKGTDATPPTGLRAWAGSEGHHPPERLPGLKYDLPRDQLNRITPAWEHDNKDVVRSNPHIIEKTWARRIDSWTGSSACPVPYISEKTFADEINATTGSETERVNKISEETWAEEVIEKTNVLKTVTSITNVAGNITETTTAGTIVGHTGAAAVVDITTAVAIIFELSAAPIHVEVEAAAAHISVELSANLDAFFGAKFEFDLAKVGEMSVFEHWEYKTKKQKATLKDTRTALMRAESYLQSDKMCVEQKLTALSSAITALKVNLGA
jgi:hypothetical protein